MKRDSRLPMESETDTPKITLDELSIDVSAFMHFLSEHYDGNKSPEMPSFWMLIPKALDIEWRDGAKGVSLEKEVFSRTILIVAPPVSVEQEERRRVELLLMFQNSVTQDQTKQILLLVSRLSTEARELMIEDFKRYKSSQGNS